MSHRSFPLAAAAVAAVSLVVGCQATTPVPDYDGANLFQGYCASCHGMDAAGDGPLAAKLAVAPPDLRTLEARYGSFPRERLEQIIDGRGMRSVHGTQDMPVWGWAFYDAEQKAGEEAPRELAAARIEALVDYLESIQVVD